MLRKVTYASLIIVIIGVTVWGLITYNSLLRTRSDLNLLGREVAALEISLEEAEHRMARTEEDLVSANLTIGSLESQLQLCKDTWGSVFTQDLSSGPDLWPGTWYMRYLVNKESATDPTWSQLLDFLLEDRTDQDTGRPSIHDCGYFARDLHNNAESAGIRAACVHIRTATVSHAFNAFRTTDRGLVFIDCTGLMEPEPGRSYDRVVDVQLGGNYACRYLFPEGNWTTHSEWGTLTELRICW
jgi:hypothetical protein